MRASDRLLLTCSREVGFLPPAASPSIAPSPSHISVIPPSLSTLNEIHCNILSFLIPFFSSYHFSLILGSCPKPVVLSHTHIHLLSFTHLMVLFCPFCFTFSFSITIPVLSSLVSLCSPQAKQSE